MSTDSSGLFGICLTHYADHRPHLNDDASHASVNKHADHRPHLNEDASHKLPLSTFGQRPSVSLECAASSDEDEVYSARIAQLRSGRRIPGNLTVPVAHPAWYDATKFSRGKQFLQDNLICVFLSELMSILTVFTSVQVLKPLMYTDKSSQPYTALKRYVSTIRTVLTWYDGDIWNPEDRAHKALQYVRKSHSFVSEIANGKRRESVDKITAPPANDPHCVRFYEAVREDLVEYSRVPQVQNDSENNLMYFNQWDMMIVQYAFMGAMVARPTAFGLWNASVEEVEGFIHFWRVIGYLMGLDDDYNLCSGTCCSTKALIYRLEREEILPNFSAIDNNFEHMGKALMEGINIMVPFIKYPCTLHYLIKAMGGKTDKLYKTLSVREKIVHGLMRAVTYSCKIRLIKTALGALFRVALELIEDRGPWWWPRMLRMKTTIPPSPHI